MSDMDQQSINEREQLFALTVKQRLEISKLQTRIKELEKENAALKTDNARMKKEIEDIFRAENGG